MAGDRISLDDLLAQQSLPEPLLATVEPIAGDADRVRITPFLTGKGCSCSSSLNVLKTHIEAVQTTGQTHLCCGKKLMVVEIVFSNPVVADVVQQLRDGAPPPAQAVAVPSAARLNPALFPRTSALIAGVRRVGTLDELSSGFYDDYTCSEARAHCRKVCVRLYRSDLEGRELCNCECENDYNSCLDPNFTPNPCNPF